MHRIAGDEATTFDDAPIRIVEELSDEDSIQVYDVVIHVTVLAKYVIVNHKVFTSTRLYCGTSTSC
jgi:hypothetical protein